VVGHAAYTRWTMPAGTSLATIPPPALGLGTTTRETTHRRRRPVDRLTRHTGPPDASVPSPVEQWLRDHLTLAS
jgi:hypothetical protein